MDLYSGLPYWLAKNKLKDYYNPLTANHETEIAIIGSGITGALVAHELCGAGLKCTMLEKRGVSEGSSTSSTALLQYEIDVPLHKMIKMMPEENAVLAYRSCLDSISDIREVLRKVHADADFEHVPSVFYASNGRGLDLIREEFAIRKKYGLPCEFLTRKELKAAYGIKAPGALVNDTAAQMDPYAAAGEIVSYHMREKCLNVFTHTTVTECTPIENGYMLKTAAGNTVKCDYVIIAAGFESGKFLPKQVMELTSTYALISDPVPEGSLWREKALIWETREPYLYIRTDGQRIIVGGEDENFQNPRRRDKLLRSKTETLAKKFSKLFPDIPFRTDMSWCGTFSSTKDGLPFIGPWNQGDRMLYALGYGGNGITFSMIAAQILRNHLTGVPDKRAQVLGFDRMRKK